MAAKEFTARVKKIDEDSISIEVAGFSLDVPFTELFDAPPDIQATIMNNIKLNLAIAGTPRDDFTAIQKAIEGKVYKGIE